jgi:hypothetical protein
MNLGKNKGRRLRGALSRFASMLIEEARDLTGMTHTDLDAALELPEGQSYRYSLYPMQSKTRAPQAASIQQLENRVAKLLKRVPHQIVIYDNAKLMEMNEVEFVEDAIGKPSSDMNLRNSHEYDLQLGYEADWPTYRRLKIEPEKLKLYQWQWGIFWDRTQPCPYRKMFGVREDVPVEQCLAQIMEAAMRQAKLFDLLCRTKAGQELLKERG